MRILMIVLFVALGIGYGGWYGEHQKHRADVAKLQKDASDKDAEQERSTRTNLQAAIYYANQMTIAQAARDADRATKQQEISHAIKSATSGRPCLGGAALRLLDTAPGLHAPNLANANGGAGGAKPTASTTASDEGEDVATDTDIAEWINVAAGLYQRCSERFDALATWAKSPTGAGK